MTENELTKVEGSGEVSMSLYEINQNIIAQLPSYDYNNLLKLKKKINSWEKANNIYYMLLCKDASYYTVLYRGISTPDFRSLGEAVITLFDEAGYTIHADEEYEDHIEIWGKKDDNTYAFMLFPYDQGVVRYG